MGLEEVRDEILENAKKQAAEIVAEANREAYGIMNQAETGLKQYKKKAEEKKKKTLEHTEGMSIAQANSEIKKNLLNKKKEIIDSLFEKARDKLKSLNDKQRQDYINSLLEKAKKEIDVGEIHCNKQDMKFVKDFKCIEADIIGGIIAENKDKNMGVSYSYEALLENLKENLMQDIAKNLFK